MYEYEPRKPRLIELPMTDEVVCSLHVGDAVVLNGIMLTGRDVVHRWMCDLFIQKTCTASQEDLDVYEFIKPHLEFGAIYHCGPIVACEPNSSYRIVSAGPTTSIREEPYQADVIRHFKLKTVIGKGGMGARTLAACSAEPAVYLHAVGGAAAVIAESVVQVLFVKKLDFGIPEAIWGLQVSGFPAVVTMDSHGSSLHSQVQMDSAERLKRYMT